MKKYTIRKDYFKEHRLLLFATCEGKRRGKENGEGKY